MVLENDHEVEQPEKPVRLGKGQKHGHKKGVIVTSVYTIAPLIRTPQAAVDSFFDLAKPAFDLEPQKQARPKPQNKHTWATLDGKDAALERLAKDVHLLEGDHIQERVALCDGCEALQVRLRLYLVVSRWFWTSSTPTCISGKSPMFCSAKPVPRASPGWRKKRCSCSPAKPTNSSASFV